MLLLPFIVIVVVAHLLLPVAFMMLIHGGAQMPFDGHCPKCRYDMRGSPSRTCSECSYILKDKDVHREQYRSRTAMVVAIVMIIPAFVIDFTCIATSMLGAR
jgi:hypothetical protein